MKKPVRLQLSRRKGFNLQVWSKRVNGLPAIVVSRPARWSNPWRIGAKERGKIIDRSEALKRYRAFIRGKHDDIRRELRGYNLACWCSADLPCHADMLLKIANAPQRATVREATRVTWLAPK
jgi:hypothetical protein